MQIAVRHFKTTFSRGNFIFAIYQKIESGEVSYVTCKGYNLPQNKNCFYWFEGEMTIGKNNKEVFDVSSFSASKPKTKNTIQMYLLGDEFAGVGKELIKRLVKTFDANTFEIIENYPHRLLEVEGMTAEKADLLIECYNNSTALNKLSRFLSPMGVTQRQLNLIHDNNITVERIKDNPFSLIEIQGIGFKTCDMIARYSNVALNCKERVDGGIIETLKDYAQQGNTWMVDTDLIEQALFKLNNGLQSSAVTRKDVVARIVSLIASSQIYVDDKHKMSLYCYNKAENMTARQIVEMLKGPVDCVDELIKAVEDFKDGTTVLSKNQLEAVKLSLSNKISVITGGAGTGKTTIVKALLSAYKKVFPNREITLLAPTGKAARRMTEATGLYASTIHSRLGIYEGSEMLGAYISDGLVIVDEFSMVDILLFEKLMEAVSFSCQIVLVGDINQLPSVGAGACLKDVIESGTVPVAYLKDVFRNSGTIIEDSIKVIKGDTDLKFDNQVMYVHTKNEEEMIKQIKKIYKYYSALDGIENVALITPLRSTQNGRFKCTSDALNSIIQDSINKSDVCFKKGSECYKLGDRVMMWKNTQYVSNGDVGVITRLETENPDWGFEMDVHWENGHDSTYHKKDLESIKLAYAMTVHKSQGSEYGTVIIPVLSDQKCRLFRNNLLYTAISRSIKRCIILSDDPKESQKTLKYMIQHSDTSSRNTLLSSKMKVYAKL